MAADDRPHVLSYRRPVPAPKRGPVILASATPVILVSVAALSLSVHSLWFPVSRREFLPAVVFGGLVSAVLILEILAVVARSGIATAAMIGILLLSEAVIAGNFFYIDLGTVDGLMLYGVGLAIFFIIVGHLRWWLSLREWSKNRLGQ